MKQKIKNAVISLVAIATAAVPAFALAPAALAAAPPNISGNLCQGAGLDVTSTGATCDVTTGTNNVQTLLTNIINWFSIIVGVIAVIMIIVGGLKYITSGGESGKVSSAKTTIIYALIGLVVVALAQLIVHFVLGQASTIVNG